MRVFIASSHVTAIDIKYRRRFGRRCFSKKKKIKMQILSQDIVHIKLCTGVKGLEELTEKKSTEGH